MTTTQQPSNTMAHEVMTTAIDRLREELFALVSKLHTQPYGGIHAQLDDAEQIGKLAAELRTLYRAREIITRRGEIVRERG